MLMWTPPTLYRPFTPADAPHFAGDRSKQLTMCRFNMGGRPAIRELWAIPTFRYTTSPATPHHLTTTYPSVVIVVVPCGVSGVTVWTAGPVCLAGERPTRCCLPLVACCCMRVDAQ